jgi:chromate transporter
LVPHSYSLPQELTLPSPTTAQSISVFELFKAWFLIGIQSFGGGSSTLFLIHQACIQRGWLDEEAFTRAWGLVQISPGINLVKLTVLVGYHLRGWRGLVASMTGLLLPSATLTVLMTAGFTVVRDLPAVQAALKGVLPAAVGLSLAMSFQMAQALLGRARQEGPFRLALHTSILVGSALLLSVAKLTPLLVLVLAGLTAMLLHAALPLKQKQAVRE